MTTPVLLLVVVVVVALGSTVALARRVPAGHAGVRERMGTYDETLAPGWHLKLPGDRIVAVSLAEQRMRVRRQAFAAGDGLEVMVEADLHYRVEDAYRAVTEVPDVGAALESVTLAAVRSWVASRDSAGVAATPDELTEEVRRVLAGAAPPWGVRVLDVDVRIDRPA